MKPVAGSATLLECTFLFHIFSRDLRQSRTTIPSMESGWKMERNEEAVAAVRQDECGRCERQISIVELRGGPAVVVEGYNRELAAVGRAVADKVRERLPRLRDQCDEERRVDRR